VRARVCRSGSEGQRVKVVRARAMARARARAKLTLVSAESR
jgi:hypothetical protein